MDAQLIGKMVRFHHKQTNLTQAELGTIAGLGKTVIFDIEKGKLSIRLETLLKVFRILNIKIDFQSPLMHLFKQTEFEES